MNKAKIGVVGLGHYIYNEFLERWNEGHFVSPSHKFGFKYLQAIREAFTSCNNLPDYIMPQDQGFDGYNKSWITPDFKEYCEKKLKENE